MVSAMTFKWLFPFVGMVAMATDSPLQQLMGGLVTDGTNVYASGLRISAGTVPTDRHIEGDDDDDDEYDKCDEIVMHLFECLFDEFSVCKCVDYFTLSKDCPHFGPNWGEVVDAVEWTCSDCFSALWELATTWQCWDLVNRTLDEGEACGSVCRPLICDSLAVCPEGGMEKPNMTEYDEVRQMLLEATEDCKCNVSREEALERLSAWAGHLPSEASPSKPALRVSTGPAAGTVQEVPSTRECLFEILALLSTRGCVTTDRQAFVASCGDDCHALKCSSMAACPVGLQIVGLDFTRFEQFRAELGVDNSRCPCSV